MSRSRNITNIAIILLLLIGVVLFAVTKILEQSNNEAMEYSDFQLENIETIDTSAVLDYTFLGETSDVVTTIYSFLIEPQSHDEKSILRLAQVVNKKHCTTGRCTMNIFDNKRAYSLYAKRLELIKNDFGQDYGTDAHKWAQRKWDKQNYVFIADHLVGVYYFGGDIFYFPYRDDYYISLKGRKAAKKKPVVVTDSITTNI
ncbi:MAG: hypothetical protein OCC49_08160 [Fibrobacterales bacterium]